MTIKNKKWIGIGSLIGMAGLGVGLGITLPIVLTQNSDSSNLVWYVQGNENQSGQQQEHSTRASAEAALVKMAQKSKIWKTKDNSIKEYDTQTDAWEDHMINMDINKSEYHIGDFMPNDQTGIDISSINKAAATMPVFVYANKTYKDLLHAQNAWLNDNPIKTIGKGDKSGNTYTQAELDKRDGKFVPRDAVEGLNTKGVGKVGLGDGKEYVKREGFALTPKGKISVRAVIGHNYAGDYYTSDEVFNKLWEAIDNDINTTYNLKYVDSPSEFLAKWRLESDSVEIADLSAVTKTEMKNLIQKISRMWYGLELINMDMWKVNEITSVIFNNNNFILGEDVINPSTVVGLGNGNTYVAAEGYTLKEDGPTGDYVDGAVEGINSKEVKGVGDQSNKTYTKSQIDARNVTITAGNNAILGLNEVDVINEISDVKSDNIIKKWIKTNDYNIITNGVNWNNYWLPFGTQEMFWLGSDKTKAFTTKGKLKEWYKKTNSDYVTQSDSISKVDIKIGDEIMTFKSLAHAKNEIIKNKYV